MKHRTGGTLALLLALVMLVGLLPGMTAWADAVPSCNPANGGIIEYQGECIYARANSGYHLVCWEMSMQGIAGTFKIKNNTVDSYALEMFDTVTARFAPDTFTVTVHPGANGAAAVSAHSAAEGETIAVNGVPFEGYAISEILWSADGGATKNNITDTASFVMPAMDVAVYVTFRPVG